MTQESDKALVEKAGGRAVADGPKSYEAARARLEPWTRGKAYFGNEDECRTDVRLLLNECERLKTELESSERAYDIVVEQARTSEAELAAERKRAESWEHKCAEAWERRDAAEERAKRLELVLKRLYDWWLKNDASELDRCGKLAGLALRFAVPEPRPEGCTCGDSWPCLLHGGPPGDPTPTITGVDWASGPDFTVRAGSEQPDYSPKSKDKPSD